jgi:hypothetical protein
MRPREALETALQLGLPSFPCRPDKAPACPTGFHAAQPPSPVLMSLWDQCPGELIGIPTGEVTGIAVVDVDRKKGGDEWYAENKSRLPATRIHRTGSGGIHLLFKHREGLRCSTSKIAPGVDVRAEGGYFIWWPTEGLDVRDAPLAEWPAWLEWLISEPEERAPRVTAGRGGAADPFAAAGSFSLSAIDGLIQTVATAPEGQRNTVTYWAACRMRERIAEGQIAEDLARDIILEAAQVAGLPRREAARTFESAMVGASS